MSSSASTNEEIVHQLSALSFAIAPTVSDYKNKASYVIGNIIEDHYVKNSSIISDCKIIAAANSLLINKGYPKLTGEQINDYKTTVCRPNL